MNQRKLITWVSIIFILAIGLTSLLWYLFDHKTITKIVTEPPKTETVTTVLTKNVTTTLPAITVIKTIPPVTTTRTVTTVPVTTIVTTNVTQPVTTITTTLPPLTTTQIVATTIPVTTVVTTTLPPVTTTKVVTTTITTTLPPVTTTVTTTIPVTTPCATACNSLVMSFGAYGICWYDGQTYYCYYSYDNFTKIGRATSPDGINWTNDTADNPVLTTGCGGAWDSSFIAVCNVWQESGTWYALYGDGNNEIGLATSADGIKWTKYGSNPVIQGLSYASDPCGIIKVGATYYLYANDSSGYGSNRGIDILTSTDLHSWTLQTPSPTFSGDRFCSVPFKYNGMYYLIVSGYCNNGNGGILELWQASNPSFNNATDDGIIASDANQLVDVPSVITDTINRDSFPNNALYLYYSKTTRASYNWVLYLTIQTNIKTALQGN